MNKKEIIWREILLQAIENKKIEFTQKELAQKYSFSLSTVFNALKAPRNISAIEGKRGLRVRDIEKLLRLWTTFRNLKKDIIYQTHVSKSVREIENEMPSEIIFGAYSAFIKKYSQAPADYDKIYVYLPENKISEIKDRFPYQKGYSNLIVLRADPWLSNFGKLTPDCQIFVDLWNLPEWYAKDFLNALEDKILK
jgi:hypothetical protein